MADIRLLRGLILISTAILLVGCAGGDATNPGSPEGMSLARTGNAFPSNETLTNQPLSYDEAIDVVKTHVGAVAKGFFAMSTEVDGLELEGDTLVYVKKDGSHVKMLLRQDLVPAAQEGAAWLFIDAEKSWRVASDTPVRTGAALMALKRAPAYQLGLADFDEIARPYRDAAVKPVPGEDVRRYQVQAEDAVNEKRFTDAARAYGAALEIAPWWPAGHFDRAIVLGELGRYPQAVREMKMYLMLVPNTPDARKAQDTIYRWEAKAPEANRLGEAPPMQTERLPSK